MTATTQQTGHNFFIFGLARSRTAWLANFFTTGNIFCYHEAINGCRSITEYKEKLGNDGDSSTGMMFFDMNAMYPDSPIVIIESDPKKSIEYGYRTYGIYNPASIYACRDMLDSIEGLKVKLEDIDKRLPEMWEYLIGGGYDAKRAEMLMKLNVQVSNPHDIDYDAARELFNGQSIPED